MVLVFACKKVAHDATRNYNPSHGPMKASPVSSLFTTLEGKGGENNLGSEFNHVVYVVQ